MNNKSKLLEKDINALKNYPMIIGRTKEGIEIIDCISGLGFRNITVVEGDYMLNFKT